MNLTVILPILNEEEIIEQSIASILKKAEKLTDKVEVIAVDDGSTDSTPEILKKLSQRDRRIRIITHSPNLGYGAALRSGVSVAKYDWVFFTDSDMQFDVNDLKNFMPYMKNFDYIVGKRIKRADALRRVIISKVYNNILRFIFRLPMRDVDCAFKLMRRGVIRSIPYKSSSFFVSAELMVRSLKNGVKIKELDVRHLPRIRGQSKVTPSQIIKTIRDLSRLYFEITK